MAVGHDLSAQGSSERTQLVRTPGQVLADVPEERTPTPTVTLRADILFLAKGLEAPDSLFVVGNDVQPDVETITGRKARRLPCAWYLSRVSGRLYLGGFHCIVKNTQDTRVKSEVFTRDASRYPVGCPGSVARHRR